MADSGSEAREAQASPRVVPSSGGPGSDPGPGASAEPGQSLVGGLVLVAFALFALWTMRDLDSGSLRQIGSGGLPRAVAILLGLLGAGIAVYGLRTEVSRFQHLEPRPVVMVLLAIFVFAATIRPLALGPVTTPGLGLVGAGPLTVLVAGFAERERDWLDLSILATGLTAFCMLLFGDALGLPIPAMPTALLGYFPGWEQRGVLRLLAGLLIGIAAGLYLIRRRRGATA
jgi:hypothetical protein